MSKKIIAYLPVAMFGLSLGAAHAAPNAESASALPTSTPLAIPRSADALPRLAAPGPRAFSPRAATPGSAPAAAPIDLSDVSQSFEAPQESSFDRPGFSVTSPSLHKDKDQDLVLSQEESSTLTLTTEELQNNEALTKDVLVHLLRVRNTDGLKVVLPIYEKFKKPDPALVAFAQGLIAMDDDEPGQAQEAFHRFLKLIPESEVARFYLAMASYQNKDYWQAKRELNKINNDDLPQELQIVKGAALMGVAARQMIMPSVSLSFFHDGNVNRAPDQRHYGGWTFPEKKKDWAMQYGLNASKTWMLPYGLYAGVSASLSGKKYRRLNDYDDMQVRPVLKFGWHNVRHDVSLNLYHQWRWYGHNPYSQTDGVSARWNYAITPRVSTGLSVGHERERYQDYRFLNAKRYMAGADLGVIWNAYFSSALGVNVTRHTGTRDKDDRYTSWSVMLNQQFLSSGGLNLVGQVSFDHTRYDAPTFFTNNRNRVDKVTSLELRASYNPWQWMGVTPELVFRVNKHRSNSVYHNYQDQGVFVQLRRAF